MTRFDTTEYPNLQAVLGAVDLFADNSLPADLQALDRTVLFWCDINNLVEADPMDDTSPFWVGANGEVLQMTTEPEICPSGVNTRIAKHPATINPPQPAYLVVILCPEILTQTPGRPKMWATLDGQELTDTRPTADTQDNLLWTGMHIDALRQKVLSVWIGRMALLITSIKYSDRIHSKLPH